MLFSNRHNLPKLVVFTGAGISAESGLKTFRDSGGLWEEHDVRDVATPEGWLRNPSLVLNFYNDRRKQVLEAKPNPAHLALVKLSKKFDVRIVTQNIDDLHERAGSKNVIHLHGEIRKSRSTANPNLVYDIKGWQMKPGDLCELGSPLRPHIVWFGEQVPMMDLAATVASMADIFIVIGTSLNVYPAAGLIDMTPPGIPKYIVDPNEMQRDFSDIHFIRKKASEGVPELVEKLLSGDS